MHLVQIRPLTFFLPPPPLFELINGLHCSFFIHAHEVFPLYRKQFLIFKFENFKLCLVCLFPPSTKPQRRNETVWSRCGHFMPQLSPISHFLTISSKIESCKSFLGENLSAFFPKMEATGLKCLHYCAWV
jgi:hypothetical protein